MKYLTYSLLAGIISAAVAGCGGSNESSEDSGSVNTGTVDTGSVSSDSEEQGDAAAESAGKSRVLDPGRFSTANLISDFQLVDCTLSDGTETQCYTVTFGNTPELTGSLCPQTIADTGGIGIYDGPTDPGLHVLNAELWAIFEADGFDIVDDSGNVNVVVPDGPPGMGAPGTGAPGAGLPGDDTFDLTLNGSCLEAELIEDLQLRYTIPATPSYQAQKVSFGGTDFRGILLDGFPLAAPPPATVNGDQAAIPALDSCGGHPQPAGPFHWHIVPQESNHVLAASNIDEVVCDNVTQSSTQLIGYAGDGFPIYGSLETDGTDATGLDDCRGHVSSTADFSDGIYHYHISSSAVPNTLDCLHGATVNNISLLEYQ